MIKEFSRYHAHTDVFTVLKHEKQIVMAHGRPLWSLHGDCMGGSHLQHNYYTKQPEPDACIALPALSSAMVCVQVWPFV